METKQKVETSKKKQNFKLDNPATIAPKPEPVQIKDMTTAKVGILLNQINNRMNLLNQDRVSLLAELEKRDKADG